jgi:hypothetical protein
MAGGEVDVKEMNGYLRVNSGRERVQPTQRLPSYSQSGRDKQKLLASRAAPEETYTNKTSCWFPATRIRARLIRVSVSRVSLPYPIKYNVALHI